MLQCTQWQRFSKVPSSATARRAGMLRFPEQLKKHSVALISLTIAVTSLAYNTWRNEQSEENRTVRTAGIELLIKLGELDRIILEEQFGETPVVAETRTSMNQRSGWAYALTIRDLGSVMVEPAKSSSVVLFDVWSTNSDNLGERDQAAFKAVSASIDKLRGDVLISLAELD